MATALWWCGIIMRRKSPLGSPVISVFMSVCCMACMAFM